MKMVLGTSAVRSKGEMAPPELVWPQLDDVDDGDVNDDYDGCNEDDDDDADDDRLWLTIIMLKITSAVRSSGEMLPPELVRPQPETKPDLVDVVTMMMIVNW